MPEIFKYAIIIILDIAVEYLGIFAEYIRSLSYIWISRYLIPISIFLFRVIKFNKSKHNWSIIESKMKLFIFRFKSLKKQVKIKWVRNWNLTVFSLRRLAFECACTYVRPRFTFILCSALGVPASDRTKHSQTDSIFKSKILWLLPCRTFSPFTLLRS